MSSGHKGGWQDDGIYRRLVWLTLLRIGVVAILLAAAAAVLSHSDVSDLGGIEQVLYGLILGTYLASIGYLVVLRRSRRVSSGFVLLQVLGDVLIASCLVYLTGGAESIVVFLFPLAVVSAAVVSYRRGALASAILSSAALSVVAVGLNARLLPSPAPSLVQPAVPGPRLAFTLFAHISAIFLTAALASYLAEQLRTTRERLTLREIDYRALEILHESIVRSVASGIVTVDSEGRVTFANPAAERLAGVEGGFAIGKPLELLFPNIPRIWSAHFSRHDVSHASGDVGALDLSVTIAPLVDRVGHTEGSVISIEDVTSIRAMQEAVRQTERLAVVGGMAAGLAHELRNPLASMTGSVQLLAEGMLLSNDDRRLMDIVIREADRLEKLVADFLRFAKPAPLRISCVDLARVVTAAVALFRNDSSHKSIEVRERLQPGLFVKADEDQLGQVVWNLLANAADALAGVERPFIEVSSMKVGAAMVGFKVFDSGTGISPDVLPCIFDPFFTTKEKGTGLGLATVHSIVRAHGGEVGVTSREMHGTGFTVILPAADPSSVGN